MTAIKQNTAIIKKEYHISKARILARDLAIEINFDSVRVNQIVTSVSELANNIYFHCHAGGEICLMVIKARKKIGLQIVARDAGPGIPDVNAAMEDGFSTNHGLGGGLGGVKRLMDEFEIVSTPGKGTTITARKWR